LLLSAGVARAGWEPGEEVDVQGGGSSATSDSVWDYLAVADGANGLTSAFFEQTVSGHVGYYAIRRGASDAAWSSPLTIGFPSGVSPQPNLPLSAAADSQGNAIDVTPQTGAGGREEVLGSAWSASAAAPSPYQVALSDPANSLTNPSVAFDGAGNGYAVAGQSQDSPSDGPIWLSTYSPASATWTAAGAITAGNMTCSGVKGVICGREPRLAVSPDGTLVVAYLACTARCSTFPQTALFAVRRAAGEGSFSGPFRISANSVPTTGPLGSPAPPNLDVAVDGSDDATIVDAESANGGATSAIYAARWSPGADPSGEVQISNTNPVPAPASEPRVVADSGGDATVIWTESTPNPSSASLMSVELLGPDWTTPETVSSSVDSPATEVPPFWLAEDASGAAYAVFTNDGSVQAATRQARQAWTAVDTLSGGSNAVTGAVRVSAGTGGQADAIWVASNDSGRSAAFASRYVAPPAPPAPPPGRPPSPPPPQRGPLAIPPPRKPAACVRRPFSRIIPHLTHASHKGIVVRGTAGEHLCRGAAADARRRERVARVYVMIYHPSAHGRCRFVRRDGKVARPRSCAKPLEYLARGTSSWVLKLRLRLARGRYLIRADAVDAARHHQRHTAASVVRVIVR
jgi:hypothetical protein